MAWPRLKMVGLKQPALKASWKVLSAVAESVVVRVRKAYWFVDQVQPVLVSTDG